MSAVKLVGIGKRTVLSAPPAEAANAAALLGHRGRARSVSSGARTRGDQCHGTNNK
jgi:hypothetical protein